MIYSYLCDALQPPPAENKNMLPPVLRILTFFDLIPDPTYHTELSGSDKVFLRLKTCRHCINLYKKSAWIWHQILIKNKNWSTNCFNWRQAAKRRRKKTPEKSWLRHWPKPFFIEVWDCKTDPDPGLFVQIRKQRSGSGTLVN